MRIAWRPEPGARTTGTRTTAPQWLLVVEGRIRIQKLGEPAHEAVVRAMPSSSRLAKNTGTAPLPDARGVHLALNVNASQMDGAGDRSACMRHERVLNYWTQ